MPLPTLDDVKQHLNVPADDTSHDVELVETFIPAAVKVVEGVIGTPLVPTTVTERHAAGSTIIPRYTRVVSLTSVTDPDGVALTDFALDEGLLRSSYWYGYGRVTVTYVAGFDEIPADIYLAVMVILDHLWRSQRGGGPSALPDEGEPFGAPGSGYLIPNQAAQLLLPYAYKSPGL